MTELSGTITLGVQSSGDDDRIGEHVLELRSLLAAYCKGPYSDEISEFALVLRVGGQKNAGVRLRGLRAHPAKSQGWMQWIAEPEIIILDC